MNMEREGKRFERGGSLWKTNSEHEGEGEKFRED